MSALGTVTSIKTKLGLLVAASVVVAAVVGAVGGVAQVSWWILLPVTVLLSLTVTQLLAAGMVAPLREMTAAASAMSRGDWTRRVYTDNTDEVGVLARAFNTMAEDLAAVDSERRDLIATVSHELRTPVTAVTAQLENLADGVVEATPERLAQVLATAERLGDLVADLLTLSRLEAGVVDLDRRETELRPLVELCVAEVHKSGRTAEVVVEVPEDLAAAVDPGRLRQLVVNAVDNACRHTAAGEPVRVLAAADGEMVWLEVRDGGEGVAPADRERVFERFGTDSGGGTGLGLAIARWVATLHGGTLAFVDPAEDEGGARLRLELPVAGPALPAGAAPGARADAAANPSATQATAAPTPASHPTSPTAVQGPLYAVWPARDDRARPGLVGASALVGLLGAGLIAFNGPGLGWSAVLVGAGAVAWWASERRRARFTLTCSLLALGLVLMMTWTDNEGLAMLGTLAASGVFLAGLTEARTFIGILLSGLAWPLSSLRGLPWFGRALGVVGRAGKVPGVARTVALSLLGLVVFGALFAAADVTFARWVGAVLPDLSAGDWVVRLFVGGFVFAVTLAAVHLAVNPPRVDVFERVPARAGTRWEWLVPVLVVDAVFLLFLASQVRVVTAGHRWIRETSGLTYAEYVHQGFGQLVMATLLTLVVVWAAARRASVRAEDRAWMLGSCGVLIAAALGVVATAVGRMAVYEDAYGYTVMRLVVTVFEGWLGLVLVGIAILGILGRGRWVPRVALVSGAVVLLVLLLVRPDAVVAQRNVDRFEATGELDLAYLSSLSADSAAAVSQLPPDLAACVAELAPWSDVAQGSGRFVATSGKPAQWNVAAQRAGGHVDSLLAAGPVAGEACQALSDETLAELGTAPWDLGSRSVDVEE